MKQCKTTREITKKYNISRQTLTSWINTGILKKPEKDFRNWYSWTLEDEDNLKKVIIDKTNKNNSEQQKNKKHFRISNRRYLGSKNKLLGFIYQVIEDKLGDVELVADIFAGTGVVADMFARHGKTVIVNDLLKSNYISYITWFGNENVDMDKVEHIIDELNSINAENDNYVSINFGNKYFSLENARKIGAIREKIDTYNVNERERAFLLTSLIYAMDKVANTVGHYDAYRKKLDNLQKIELKVPEYRKNMNNKIYCEDANKLVRIIKADLIYIDTPYNSRQYGDAYHVLENIVMWKKPEVTGVAAKMVDRSETKSLYSMKIAPEIFDDLIKNIDAKYILVSYNNMAKKGNGRSNAKISNDEILKSLRKKGEVYVFDTPYTPFTTGKTFISDHRELLYLCKVFRDKKDDNYIKSAMNYTGGKHKLLNQILPLFPDKVDKFYDLFAGGANVGINIKSNSIVLNDINSKVIGLYNVFQKYGIDDLISKIESIIDFYGLSNTKKYGYEYYSVNSSSGLKSINEKKYLKLRDDFNKGLYKGDDYYLVFYVLIIFSFNNQIRFNNKEEFNMPPGKRDFNKNMELKLRKFVKAITNKNIITSSKDFREFTNYKFSGDDFVYADPPYLISTASYNENGGWTQNDEVDLYRFLDMIDNKGIKFALSNIIEHKGKINENLRSWSEKYTKHYLDFNYNNSNYQTKNSSKTVEILITNY